MNKIKKSAMPSKIADIDWTLTTPPSPYRNISCIYTIHLMDPARPSRPFPIRRFIDTDPDGILEIGQTSNLAVKIYNFKISVLGSICNDSEGWTLGYIFGKSKWMKDMFGSRKDLLNSIRFTYVKTDANLLLARECKAIDHYCGLFGEPPVTNGTVPGVTRRPDSYAMDHIPRPSSQRTSDKGPTRPGTIWLTGLPPNPMKGISCTYRVHLMDRDSPSKPFAIPRFARTDPEGIMEIGQTRDLARRLREIRYAVYGSNRHGEWALLHHIYDICSPFRKVHGPRKDILNYLYVSYTKTKPSLLAKGEIRAFNDYIDKFAEPPPMNCQIPGNTRRIKR